MSYGLFDLPSPLFDAIDAALAAPHLPAVVRISIYAVASAAVSMLAYRRWSNQPLLNDLSGEIRELQQRLLADNGSYAQTQALIVRNLALSLRKLGLTLGPALLASLPMLFVLPWVSNRFDLSPAHSVTVCATPSSTAALLHWEPQDSASTSANPACWNVSVDAATPASLKQDALTLPRLPNTASSRAIDKPKILDLLFANPDGTLPREAAVERITLDWPQREIVEFGPAWLREWPAVYFGVLVLASLALRWRWRLQ